MHSIGTPPQEKVIQRGLDELRPLFVGIDSLQNLCAQDIKEAIRGEKGNANVTWLENNIGNWKVFLEKWNENQRLEEVVPYSELWFLSMEEKFKAQQRRSKAKSMRSVASKPSDNPEKVSDYVTENRFFSAYKHPEDNNWEDLMNRNAIDPTVCFLGHDRDSSLANAIDDNIRSKEPPMLPTFFTLDLVKRGEMSSSAANLRFIRQQTDKDSITFKLFNPEVAEILNGKSVNRSPIDDPSLAYLVKIEEDVKKNIGRMQEIILKNLPPINTEINKVRKAAISFINLYHRNQQINEILGNSKKGLGERILGLTKKLKSLQDEERKAMEKEIGELHNLYLQISRMDEQQKKALLQEYDDNRITLGELEEDYQQYSFLQKQAKEKLTEINEIKASINSLSIQAQQEIEKREKLMKGGRDAISGLAYEANLEIFYLMSSIVQSIQKMSSLAEKEDIDNIDAQPEILASDAIKRLGLSVKINEGGIGSTREVRYLLARGFVWNPEDSSFRKIPATPLGPAHSEDISQDAASVPITDPQQQPLPEISEKNED